MLRLDRATDALNAPSEWIRTTPRLTTTSAVIYHLKKKYGNAIKNYKKAIALNEPSASFHSNLGTTYLQKKDFENGIKEYRRAFELDPEVFERSSRCGISARMSSPEDRARFSYVLAKLFASTGNSEKALFYLRKGDGRRLSGNQQRL